MRAVLQVEEVKVSADDRILAMLRSMDQDVPVTTWQLVEAGLGSETALAYGPRKARHWCARALAKAERLGLICRLPVKAPSRVPKARKYRRRVDKELLWRITDDGLYRRWNTGHIDTSHPPCEGVSR